MLFVLPVSFTKSPHRALRCIVSETLRFPTSSTVDCAMCGAELLLGVDVRSYSGRCETEATFAGWRKR